MRSLSWRFLKSRAYRSVLTALGVAFGVALIVTMTVLGATLQASIDDQLRQGFGTYDIMAGYDEGRLMSPEEQAKLRQVSGVRYSVGILYLTGAGSGNTNYLGIGEFPQGEFAYPVKQGARPGKAEFATEARVAEKLGVKLGESVTLPFQTGAQSVKLVGILPAQKASSDSLLFDLGWLQEQMGLGGQVTLLVSGVTDISQKGLVGANMKALLPDLHLELRTELDEVRRNMGGLKPMAIAFGVAGLFAAVFLVAGSFTVAVQERTRELALLRAVGARPGQVMSLVLGEAALLGTLGGLVGVGAGALFAWGALGAAASSLGVSHHPPVFPLMTLGLEWLAGVVLALVAAWRPARAAGAVAPLQAMRPDAQLEARQEKQGGWFGLVLLLSGMAMVSVALLLEGGSGLRALLGAGGGLLTAIGLISALPRILPFVVNRLAGLLSPLWPSESLLAARSIARHRRRNALTAAILILGIMLTTSLVTIFTTLIRNDAGYVRSTFGGDAQVESDLVDGLAPDLPGRIAALDGVTAVASRSRTIWGDVVGNDQRIGLVALDPAQFGKLYSFGTVRGTLDGGVVLTQKLSDELGLKPGATLRVHPDRFGPAVARYGLPAEPREFRITAVVEHLPFSGFEAVVDSRLLPALPPSVLFFNYEASKRTAVLDQVRQLARGAGSVRDLAESLEQSRQMGNQRWAILGAVVASIFLIAAFSLVNAVLTGLHQRKRELATLRALGSTPAQTVRQVMLEATLLGLAGSLLGFMAGLCFTGGVAAGLEMPLRDAAPGLLAIGSLLIGPALAILASIMPARRVSAGSVAQVLQAE